MRPWARFFRFGHLLWSLTHGLGRHQAITVSEGLVWPWGLWTPWRTLDVGCSCGRAFYGRRWPDEGGV
jgi:hypothetical protein